MITRSLLLAAFVLTVTSCTKAPDASPSSSTTTAPAKRDSTPPPLDPNNIVSIAMGSKDHTTLVTALQAANYVTSVANPGPLTVFAPTNAAFAKLPPGTVEGLVKPEKQADLQNILKYHVAPATWEVASLKDGMTLGMANGKKTRIRVVDGKLKIDDATVIASIRASNGIVHVVDTVLLPPAQ